MIEKKEDDRQNRSFELIRLRLSSFFGYVQSSVQSMQGVVLSMVRGKTVFL